MSAIYRDTVKKCIDLQLASPAQQKRPTPRAADGGESARFTGSFLASSFFHISSLFLPRPRPPLTQAVGQPEHTLKGK